VLQPEGGLAAATVVVVLLFTVLTPRFLTIENLSAAGLQASIFLIVAVGMCVPILARGIDVSVGSVVAISSVAGGAAAVATGSPVVGVVVPCLVGALAGLGNGVLIGYFGLSPLLVTLGSLAVLRGLALSLTNGVTVTGLPDEISILASGSVGPLRYPLLVAIVVFLAFAFALYRTRWGSYLYALGANPSAAAVAGVQVRMLTVMAYVISGSLAGLAGAILTSRTGVGSPLLGQELEFQVLPMIFLGGVVFMGGRGSLWGVLFAVAFLSALDNGLKIVGVQPFWQSALPGAALLFALLVQRALGRSDTWEYD
jgi:ribose/xylose/arabinose/galactoside ABC-type transport system permease subunit